MDYDECIKENEEKILSKGYVSCGHGAFCANYVGGYACLCKHGFEAGLIGQCADIDECLIKNVCQENAKCHNYQGSYSCDCLNGYEGDLCADIDECKDETSCHADAECHNTEGSYTCECAKGYFGNGYDYCVRGECNDAFCPDNQKCVSSRTEECTCKDGFHLKGDSDCVDIDECEDAVCNAQEVCFNTDGSYICNETRAVTTDTTKAKMITTEQTSSTTTTSTTKQTTLTSTEVTETTITTTQQSTSALKNQEKIDTLIGSL